MSVNARVKFTESISCMYTVFAETRRVHTLGSPVVHAVGDKRADPVVGRGTRRSREMSETGTGRHWLTGGYTRFRFVDFENNDELHYIGKTSGATAVRTGRLLCD